MTDGSASPFSREGARPGDGLGENNRFETLADGTTPVGFEATSAAAPSPSPEPPQAPQAQAQAPQDPYPTQAPYAEPEQPAYPEPTQPAYAEGPSFPTYPYGTVDPAQAAYRDYQAQNALQPYPPVPTGHSRPYGSPYPYAFRPEPPKSPYATVSLVLGILSVTCGITGPIGLGFGIAALRQISNEPRSYSGRGLAIGGIATSAIGTMIILLMVIGGITS
ncbi:DUF4190 domain-containing protein [Enemella dayhoffiae]|nr:DUF4190 domain-containing protein [Enemella dayhoffiae]